MTVTDANLFLGRLLSEHFSKIFGPNGDKALDQDITKEFFKELTKMINVDHSRFL